MYKTDYIVHFPKKYICKSNVTCNHHTNPIFRQQNEKGKENQIIYKNCTAEWFHYSSFYLPWKNKWCYKADKEPVHTNQFCHEFLIYTMYIRIRREETKNLFFFCFLWLSWDDTIKCHISHLSVSCMSSRKQYPDVFIRLTFD